MPETLTVRMSKMTINPHVLDNIASEYYGQVALASGFQEGEDVEVTFDDKDNLTAFTLALSPFTKTLE